MSRMLPPLRTLSMALVSALFTLWLTACGGGGSAAAASASAAATTPSWTPPSLSLPRASLQASELAVLILQGDALSEAIGSYYQQARGIPAANVIRVSRSGSGDTISASDFQSLKAAVEAQLPAGIQALLLTWTQPSRVVGSCTMSITSAFALGFDVAHCANSCAATRASPYYDSESSRPQTELGLRPTMMLGATSLAAAQALVQRGLAADASYPNGEGYLLRTSDAARSVRYTDWVGLPALWSGGLALNYRDNSGGTGSNTVENASNLMFYFTGLAQVGGIASNSYRPGALADHLTSFGGYLPNGNGQMPVTSWLEAGLTGSYGTVAEPCNYTEKFPRVSVLLNHYVRGATLLEAYWKSVQWPGQGLFVGEPLARPFADQPSFSVGSSQYTLQTRALRPGGRYALQYRASDGSWVTLQTVTGPARAQPQTVFSPLPPSGSTQLRWQGPCPTDAAQTCALASAG